MKQLDMKCKTQQTKNIKDVFTENEHQNFNSKTNCMKRSMASTSDRGKGAAIELNIFLTQNKGKGPPGRQRSPGTNKTLRFADSYGNSLSSVGAKSKTINSVIDDLSINKIDDYKIHNYKFLIHSSNFNVMKKQFLFLVLFVLALFVGTNTVYGQLPRATKAVTPLSCTANATFLNPVAGVPFGYSMDGSTGTDVVSGWKWFATKDPNFMTASGTFTTNILTQSSGQLLNVDANYNTAAATAGNTVTITWTPEILANTLYHGTPSVSTFPSPTFVVGYGKGTNCADNIKVYEINPMKNFVVAIDPIDPATMTSTATWGATVTSCVASVVSATYNAGNLVMDYGVNTLYFEVAAANFVKNFQPTLTLISGLNGAQTAVVTLYSSFADAQAGSNVLATQNWASGAAAWDTNVKFTATNAADVANGVSVFVKVVITNHSYESLAVNPFVLAVDARDNDNTGIWDMEDSDCATVTDAADQVDRATHVVNPRPTILGYPDTNPTPDNQIVPKNP